MRLPSRIASALRGGAREPGRDPAVDEDLSAGLLACMTGAAQPPSPVSPASRRERVDQEIAPAKVDRMALFAGQPARWMSASEPFASVRLCHVPSLRLTSDIVRFSMPGICRTTRAPSPHAAFAAAAL